MLRFVAADLAALLSPLEPRFKALLTARPVYLPMHFVAITTYLIKLKDKR